MIEIVKIYVNESIFKSKNIFKRTMEYCLVISQSVNQHTFMGSPGSFDS